MRLLAAVCVVLIPGLFAWWTGRKLVRRRDDPLLSEQLMARRQRAVLVVFACAGVATILVPACGLLLYALASVAYAAGGFPCRKALYEEHWSFPRYATGMLRFYAAYFGFWLLLAGAPDLIEAVGTWRWPAAAVLAAVLIAWNVWFSQVFVWITGARPMARADLEARFAAIVAATAIHPPRVLRFGFAGGRLVNAFALPSPRRSTVVFTDDVLNHFEPDEVTAVFAHEVAHLEHYDRRRLRRQGAVELSLVVLACVAVPLAASWHPLSWAASVWAVVVLVGLGVWRARHKHHEAESDVRGAALCGDPAVMARALVKLTALGLFPRRWAADFERSASHPSLARRIQALRAMAGHATDSLPEPVIAAAILPGEFVILDTDQAWWLSGVTKDVLHEAGALLAHAKSSRAIQYSELSELRVSAGVWAPQPALVARTTAGRRWTLVLRPEDVARVQAALDRVDGQLAAPPAVRPPRPVLDRLAVAAALVLGAAMAPSVVLGLTAHGTRRTRATVAHGASRSGREPRRRPRLSRPRARLSGWAHALPGEHGDPAHGARGTRVGMDRRHAAESTRAWDSRREADPHRPRCVGACADRPWAVGNDGVVAARSDRGGGAEPERRRRHHRARRSAPHAPLARGPWLGRPGGLVVVLGATAILASAGWLGSSLPEAGPVAKLRWTDAGLRLVRHADIDGAADGLRVALSGRRFALEFEADDELQRPQRFRVGAFDDTTREISADDLQFLDDDRILVTRRVESGTDVSIAHLDGTGPTVSRGFIPRMQNARLVVDGSQWMAHGGDPAARTRVAAFGRLDEGEPVVERWPVPARVRDAHIVAPGIVFVTRSTEAQRSAARRARSWPILQDPIAGTELARFEPTRSHTVGSRPIYVHCADALVRPGSVLCEGHSARAEGSAIWRLDAESRDLPAAVLLPGTRRLSSRAADGRLVAFDRRTVLLLDLARGHGVRATLPADSRWPEEAVLLGDQLAVLTTGRDTSRVTLYELTEPTAAPTRR